MKHGPQLLLALFVAVAGGLGWFLFGTSDGTSRTDAAARDTLDTSITRTETDALESVARREGPARSEAVAPRSEAERAERARVAERPVEATGPYTGRLVDSLGRPVVDTEVRLQSWEDASAPLQPQFGFGMQRPSGEAGTTDRDGHFAVESKKPFGRSIGVTAEVPGYSDDPIKCVLDPDRGRELGDVFLQPAVHVTGWVRDADDRPVAGARVRRIEREGDALVDMMDKIGFAGILGLATTDTDGRFELPHEDPGTIILLIEHEDILPERYDGPARRGGEVLQDIVIRAQRAGSIEGRVISYPEGRVRGVVTASIVDEALTEDSHSSSVGDLMSAQMGTGDHSAEIEGDGTFIVSGLLPGAKYELRAVDRKMFVQNIPISAPVVAASGGGPVSLQFDAGATGRLRVVDAKTDRPVEALTISGRFGTTPALLQLTEDAGSAPDSFPKGVVTIYELRPSSRQTAMPRTLTLTLDAPGYFRRNDVTLDVPASGVNDIGKVTLEPAPRVTFRVVDAATREPIKRARVTLQPASAATSLMGDRGRRGRGRGRTDEEAEQAEEAERLLFGEVPERSREKTDRNGRCTLTALEGDDIILEVRVRKYATYVEAGFVAPRDGGEIEIALAGGGTLLAYVVDAHGDPASDVRVECRTNAGGREKVTGERTAEDGVALFDNLAEGSYEVRAFRSGSSPWSALEQHDEEWIQVEIARGVENRVDLAVPAVGDVVGLVRLGSEPTADARVSLVEAKDADRLEAAIRIQDQMGGLSGGSPFTSLTDAEGRYQLPDVEPGDYALLVRHPDVAMVTRKDVRVAGSLTEADVIISATTLAGRVVDDEGQPIVGAKVTVQPHREGDEALGRSLARQFLSGGGADTLTDAEGRYRLIGVRSGEELDVFATATGYAEAQETRLRVADGETLTIKDLELERAGAVLVTMTDTDTSVGASFVTAEPVSGRALDEGATQKVVLMRAGRTRVDGLLAGEWRIALRNFGSAGGEMADRESKTVVVKPGETVELEL